MNQAMALGDDAQYRYVSILRLEAKPFADLWRRRSTAFRNRTLLRSTPPRRRLQQMDGPRRRRLDLPRIARLLDRLRQQTSRSVPLSRRWQLRQTWSSFRLEKSHRRDNHSSAFRARSKARTASACTSRTTLSGSQTRLATTTRSAWKTWLSGRVDRSRANRINLELAPLRVYACITGRV